MKKSLVIVLVAFVILSASIELFAEDIKIGFLVKLPEELWFQNEWKYAQQCADQYGFELIKIGIPDGEKTLSAIDSLAAQGAQGFVICTPDVYLGPAIMARAEQYRMKVFTVDDRFVGLDGKFMDVHYMGVSAYDTGLSVGVELYKEFKHRGWSLKETGALAVTFDELKTAKQKTDGTTAALVQAGFPADKIYRAPEQTTDIAGAFEAANETLIEHPDVKRWLVFSVNDEGVLGAIRALEYKGFDADTIIAIGIGSGTGLMEFKKEPPTGYFASSLVTPYRHGYETTELLYKWIKDGVQSPKVTHTIGIIVTRENYENIVEELGLELSPSRHE